jgi:hypothetical protein
MGLLYPFDFFSFSPLTYEAIASLILFLLFAVRPLCHFILDFVLNGFRSVSLIVSSASIESNLCTFVAFASGYALVPRRCQTGAPNSASRSYFKLTRLVSVHSPFPFLIVLAVLLFFMACWRSSTVRLHFPAAIDCKL